MPIPQFTLNCQEYWTFSSLRPSKQYYKNISSWSKLSCVGNNETSVSAIFSEDVFEVPYPSL